MTAEATAGPGVRRRAERPAAGRGTGGFGGLVPGAVVTLGLLGLLGAAAGGLLAIAGRIDLAQVALDPYVLGVLRFTVWQAFLSAAISVLLAIPVARALARRPAFPGRALLVRLLGLPMVVADDRRRPGNRRDLGAIRPDQRGFRGFGGCRSGSTSTACPAF